MKSSCFLLLAVVLYTGAYGQSAITAGFISAEYSLFEDQVNAEAYLFTADMNPPSTVEICWGDGNCTTTPLSGGPFLPIYNASHIYANPGTYRISIEACCYPPLSFGPAMQEFSIYTSKIVPDPNDPDPIVNRTPFLLQLPIQQAFVGQSLQFNFNATDLEGDSISYFLLPPPGVANYLYPTQVLPGPNNVLTLDPQTGDLVWDAPQKEGCYYVSVGIAEHRSNQPLDTMVTVIQICATEMEVATSSVEAKDGWHWYPNPTNDVLVVSKQEDVFSGRLEVMDQTGKVVLRKELNTTVNETKLEVRDLPAGIYIIRIGSRVLGRFVKK